MNSMVKNVLTVLGVAYLVVSLNAVFLYYFNCEQRLLERLNTYGPFADLYLLNNQAGKNGIEPSLDVQKAVLQPYLDKAADLDAFLATVPTMGKGCERSDSGDTVSVTCSVKAFCIRCTSGLNLDVVFKDKEIVDLTFDRSSVCGG